ncbi:diacylglycerol kinase family lipid kinase [Candidatus Woesebacteria bacterium]|nr:diacylglycerol kinase family lipid kinase [Candidatus Woesebacteria bacterium]
MLHSVFFIINPISGPLYPILPVIARAMKRYGLEWEIKISRSSEESYTHAKEALRQKVDAVVVYGGDGTIMEVARALCQTEMPLVILPGGTANVLAKELNIPLDPAEAIKVLGKKKPTRRELDMGLCNTKPFILRVSTGILADMVKTTTRSRKRNLGTLGYIVSALEHLSKPNSCLYSLKLDDQEEEIEGVALMIANSANLGVSGLSLVPNAKVDDGKLDVIVITQADLKSLLSMVKGSVTQQKAPSLRRFKVSTVIVKMKPVQTVLLDDEIVPMTTLDIQVLPKAVTILL